MHIFISSMTRAMQWGIMGRIWSMGRQFDTSGLDRKKFTFIGRTLVIFLENAFNCVSAVSAF